MPDLIPAHNFRAARELLADLAGVEALAPYVLPAEHGGLWFEFDQASAIAAATTSQGLAIAVGIGDKSLPFAGEEKQGCVMEFDITLYAFQASMLANGQDAELLEQLMLTAFKTASRFTYTPNLLANPIPSKLKQFAKVDLSQISHFNAQTTAADALVLSIRVRL